MTITVTIIEVALVAALVSCAILHFQYGKYGRDNALCGLGIATYLANVLMLVAFVAAGGWDSRPALGAAEAACAASVIGPVVLLLASKKVPVRGQQVFYAMSSVMCASAICAAAIHHFELRTQAEAVSDAFAVAAGLIMMVDFVIATLLISWKREALAKHRFQIGGALLAIAAFIVGLSLGINQPDGFACRMALPSPFGPSMQDVSSLVCILVVAGFTLASWDGRIGKRGVATVAVLVPAALVLVGMQGSVAICTGVGLLATLYLKTRDVNKLVVPVLLLMVAWAAAGSVSPSMTEALADFWPALAGSVNGGPCYPNIKLFANAGLAMNLDGILSGETIVDPSCYWGTIGLVANGLGLPVLAGLVLVSVSAVLGIRARRVALNGRKAHTEAMPVGVAALGVLYCSLYGEFGLVPDNVAVPCVDLGFYSCMAVLLVALMVAVCAEPYPCEAPKEELEGELDDADRPCDELPRWRTLAIACAVALALCAASYFACGAEKRMRDEATIGSLLVSYVEEAGSSAFEGSPLALYAVGEPEFSSTVAPPMSNGANDGVVARVEARYPDGDVVVGYDYRLVFPEGDVSADRLWETPRYLINVEVYPDASSGVTILDLLDYGHFESAMKRAVEGGDEAASPRILLSPGFESASARAVEGGGVASVSVADLQSYGGFPSCASGTFDVKLSNGQVVVLDAVCYWDGKDLGVSLNGIVSIEGIDGNVKEGANDGDRGR